MKIILLAGASASGKSTLARALCLSGARYYFSTSKYLKGRLGPDSSSAQLLELGNRLDIEEPNWLQNQTDGLQCPPIALAGCVVVDAIRSDNQSVTFGTRDVVRVNVESGNLFGRHLGRGTSDPGHSYQFQHPDFTWHSDLVSLGTATQVINSLVGGGQVDVLIGGQYGSEGKGKLAALLATNYDILVRSGGPNAGHWVRDLTYEFCFHHLPSGCLANKSARIYIAAGATIEPGRFLAEVAETNTGDRLIVDPNTVLIEKRDRTDEGKITREIGSTGQGVGSATIRRIAREGECTLASQDSRFTGFQGRQVSRHLALSLAAGHRVMLEGTQGSGLSLYHGPYPYTTSRDTNAAGLLAEVGLPPSAVRDTWMVVRSFPIRVGGNSGPMRSELDWDVIALRTGQGAATLKGKERTSTTNRQRRVGMFDWYQFGQACELNRPTKLFLSFADYIDPKDSGVRKFLDLSIETRAMVERLEQESGAIVAGVSTGRTQADVAWRS